MVGMTDRVFSASPYERLYGFCRAVRIGDRIEVSGTAPIPQDGSAAPTAAFDQMVLCGDIAVAALTQLGASVTDVVRTRMFITSAEDQEEIGRAHEQVFGEASPAATMLVVAGLLDPSWKVEIEVEAQVAKQTPR
jgi:enamine deaminase RidA (YjgF/YER057c/UK114 family)